MMFRTSAGQRRDTILVKLHRTHGGSEDEYRRGTVYFAGIGLLVSFSFCGRGVLYFGGRRIADDVYPVIYI